MIGRGLRQTELREEDEVGLAAGCYGRVSQGTGDRSGADAWTPRIGCWGDVRLDSATTSRVEWLKPGF